MSLWNISRNKLTNAANIEQDEESALLKFAREETRTFAQLPFSAADALVFATLSYINFTGLVPKTSLLSRSVRLTTVAPDAEKQSNLGASDSGPRAQLLRYVTENPRYADVKLNYYISVLDTQEDAQFCAVTFLLPDKTACIAFRGTDNTITGWRENFNMAFEYPVPAQKYAQEYLDAVAGCTMRRLRLVGHSKGGCLAVYAGVFCKDWVRDRLDDIYSLDGPGFRDLLFESSPFTKVSDRTHCIVPQGSMIGTLLYQNDRYRVVESSGTGFGQHSPFTWRLNGADIKEAPAGLTPEAKRFDATINSWMAKLSDEQRRMTVSTLFDLIAQTGADSFADVLDLIQSGELTMRKSLAKLEPERRREIIDVLKSLAFAYIGTRGVSKKSGENPSKQKNDNQRK